MDDIQQGSRIQGKDVEICYIFFYTNHEISERESKKKIPLKITSKRKELLRNKPNQGVERLENYETLIKETEYDSKKWKDILCS